jgi:hypothetical protein
MPPDYESWPPEFEPEPYDPERPPAGWSLRKRILFGLIAIVAILSLLGSTIAGIAWLAVQEQPGIRPTPTPTPWGYFAAAGTEPTAPPHHLPSLTFQRLPRQGDVVNQPGSTDVDGQRKEGGGRNFIQFYQIVGIGYAHIIEAGQGFSFHDTSHHVA